jgi:hypothetical protein
MTGCAECGYEYESLDRQHIVRALTALAGGFRQPLDSVDPPLLRVQPRQGSGSALAHHLFDCRRLLAAEGG